MPVTAGEFSVIGVVIYQDCASQHMNTPESFRKLSLRTAVYGGDHLGAAFLCEQAHLSKR